MPSMEIRDAQMNNARLYGLAGGKVIWIHHIHLLSFNLF